MDAVKLSVSLPESLQRHHHIPVFLLKEHVLGARKQERRLRARHAAPHQQRRDGLDLIHHAAVRLPPALVLRDAPEGVEVVAAGGNGRHRQLARRPVVLLEFGVGGQLPAPARLQPEAQLLVVGIGQVPHLGERHVHAGNAGQPVLLELAGAIVGGQIRVDVVVDRVKGRAPVVHVIHCPEALEIAPRRAERAMRIVRQLDPEVGVHLLDHRVALPPAGRETVAPEVHVLQPQGGVLHGLFPRRHVNSVAPLELRLRRRPVVKGLAADLEGLVHVPLHIQQARDQLARRNSLFDPRADRFLVLGREH